MRTKLTGKAVLLGAGAGVALFAVYGLMPGAFYGGIAGLSLISGLFGSAGTGILTRVILAVCMLLGVIGSATVFVAGGGLAGWLIGTVADAIAAPKPVKAAGKMEVKRAA